MLYFVSLSSYLFASPSLAIYLSIISSVLHSYVYIKKFPLESFSFFLQKLFNIFVVVFCSSCLLALDYLSLFICKLFHLHFFEDIFAGFRIQGYVYFYFFHCLLAYNVSDQNFMSFLSLLLNT